MRNVYLQRAIRRLAKQHTLRDRNNPIRFRDQSSGAVDIQAEIVEGQHRDPADRDLDAARLVVPHAGRQIYGDVETLASRRAFRYFGGGSSGLHHGTRPQHRLGGILQYAPGAKQTGRWEDGCKRDPNGSMHYCVVAQPFLAVFLLAQRGDGPAELSGASADGGGVGVIGGELHVGVIRLGRFREIALHLVNLTELDI